MLIGEFVVAGFLLFAPQRSPEINFERIRSGMTEEQVVTIMGTTKGLQKAQYTRNESPVFSEQYLWNLDGTVITVHFDWTAAVCDKHFIPLGRGKPTLIERIRFWLRI